MAKYRITHRTTYAYEAAVDLSHHVVMQTPRLGPRQRVLAHNVGSNPAPSWRAEAADHFGNAMVQLSVDRPHHELVVAALSEVEVEPAPALDPERTPAWDMLAAQLRAAAPEVPLEAIEAALPSPHADGNGSAVAAYAGPCFPPGRPVLAGLLDLTRRIHRDFTYKPGATLISTPVADVLRDRRGVCQDFAHLAIAGLRSLGLAARYVSGYIRTRRRDGSAFLGADQSHAWVSAWCGPLGWIDVDPTNDLLVSDAHVTVAWGRDYGDVSPLRGVILGGGRHTLAVAVTLAPLTDF